MNSKIIEYTPEQIDQACEGKGFSYIRFSDDWCGVEEVVLTKVTARCIWPYNTSQSRIDKHMIGSMHWSDLTVIKGDEDQAIDTYYARVIEEKEKEIADAQKTIAQGQKVIQERIIAKRDPETYKWVRK